MAEPTDATPVATYAIRVHGRLGPVFLSSLPYRAALQAGGRAVILADITDADLVDVLRRITDFGADIERVHRLEGPPPG